MGPLKVLAFHGWFFLSRALGEPGRPPLIVANPPADGEFRRLIDRFLLTGGGRPHDLQAALRTRYPNAVVRQRELADEGYEVWYAYRDGHWIRSEGNA
jgi:hypothetical protein